MFRILKKFTILEWTLVVFSLVLVLFGVDLVQNGVEMIIFLPILAIINLIFGLCFYSTLARIQRHDIDILTTEIAELGTTYNMVVESLNKFHNMAENAVKAKQTLQFERQSDGEIVATVVKSPEQVRSIERQSLLAQVKNELFPTGSAFEDPENTARTIISVGAHEILIPHIDARIVIRKKAVKVEAKPVQKKPVKIGTTQNKKSKAKK